ncbi:hypothetical protein [Nitrosopumilus sp.]|uniref:hypothetical protein n=1 Tax=Nitrosopumilus sp. TaxID=2024843 RepID=UPI003D12F86F
MIGRNGILSDNPSSNNKIILIDDQTDFSTVNELIKEKSHFKIISFDYKTHKKLIKEKIIHESSDNFLNENDIDQLQKQVYEFSKWCYQESIIDEIHFDKLNIGNLFHEQIIEFLTGFLKKSYEVFKICQSNPDSTFFASEQIYSLVQNLNLKVIQLKQKNKMYNFAHDKVRINIKFGNKFVTFFISRSSYKKFKNISEKLIHTFFGPKIKQNFDENVLVVEFPTNRYEELFSKSKNFPFSLFFYGRRRPAFWNLKTFDIIKKSKIKVITPHIKSSSYVAELSRKISNEISSNIELLWSKNKFFEEYFVQNNISLWKYMKPYFIELIQKRISEISYEIALAKILFQEFKIKTVLVLQEVGVTEQIIIHYAKQKGIPVSLLQIGLHYDTSEAIEANVSQSVYPIKADNFLTWGDINVNDAIENGHISPSNIIKVGAPRYDNTNVLESKEENYILLATSGPGHMHIRGRIINNIKNYNETISKICQIVSESQEQLIIKSHPSADELDVSDIAKKIDPNIKIVTTGDVLSLIRKCKVLIMVGLSTTIIESQLLQKPVIFIPSIDYALGVPQILKHESCVISSTNSLKEILSKLNTDEKFKKSVIDNGNQFLKKYLSNLNSASQTLLNSIVKH